MTTNQFLDKLTSFNIHYRILDHPLFFGLRSGGLTILDNFDSFSAIKTIPISLLVAVRPHTEKRLNFKWVFKSAKIGSISILCWAYKSWPVLLVSCSLALFLKYSQL